MRVNAQRGFTLIELMVAVAIVAILAAVGLPVYKDYNIRSKWAANVSDVEGLKKAIKVCLNENADGNACGSLAQLQNHGFAGSQMPQPKYATGQVVIAPNGALGTSTSLAQQMPAGMCMAPAAARCLTATSTASAMAATTSRPKC